MSVAGWRWWRISNASTAQACAPRTSTSASPTITHSRGSRSSIRPVELGRRLLREIDDHRSVDVKGRRIVPNSFTIALSPKDLAGFADIDEARLLQVFDALIFRALSETRRGAIEAVGAGTVVLDNVTAMPQALQSRLVRALEARSFRRDSGMVDIPLRCTVLATTRKPLRAEVRAGRFREDLFDRLGLVTVSLPPLRQRQDFVQAVHWTLRGLDPRLTISEDALQLLQRHPWPGNFRELR